MSSIEIRLCGKYQLCHKLSDGSNRMSYLVLNVLSGEHLFAKFEKKSESQLSVSLR